MKRLVLAQAAEQGDSDNRPVVEADPPVPIRNQQLAPVEEAEVALVPHDPQWALLYGQESRVVMSALRERCAAIEHFGSTAVPALLSKPIIDILVGTIDGLPPSPREIEALTAHAYVFLGEDGRRPGRWFWRKRGKTAFNLSLVPFMGDLWQDNLLVRDYLRGQPAEVQHYAGIKRQAVQSSRNSLLSYQNHKRAFMDELKMRARAWRSIQGERRGSEAL